MRASCSDEEFIRLFQTIGPGDTAKHLGIRERAVYFRRNNLEKKGLILTAPTKQVGSHPGRINLEVKNGQVLVGSDFHIWPGEESTCLRAFKKFVDDLKPVVVILNGDVCDFPRISRHPQSWESAPDPQQEIEAVQDHLDDIVKRCKRGARKLWCIGNHDARFEGMIANTLPQYRKVKGVHLSDHFPIWEKAMSCRVNEDVEGGDTMIKHIPVGGGIYATRNFTLKGGVHTVHGHLHRQSVQCISNYRRFDTYGVDAGMVADKSHAAFGYTQDAPLDWREGFALLTYLDGVLMPPELITKMDSKSVYFRGQVHKV